MVNPQVVDNQKDFLTRVFDQGFEEFDQFVPTGHKSALKASSMIIQRALPFMPSGYGW